MMNILIIGLCVDLYKLNEKYKNSDSNIPNFQSPAARMHISSFSEQSKDTVHTRDHSSRERIFFFSETPTRGRDQQVMQAHWCAPLKS